MKKILVFALLVSMCVSVLAGCGQPAQNNQTVPSSSAQQTTGEKPPETVKVTWYWNEGGVKLPEDSYVCKQILKDLNIQYVAINPIGSEYEQELQLLLAAGDVPDVITSSTNLTVNLQKWGVIQPIEKYLKEEYIPNVIRIQNNWDYALKIQTWKDGHIWAMPNCNAGNSGSTPHIRYDWLNNLGLQVPTTMDELAVVLEKFTKDDPDKNGKNDTVGTMVNEFWSILDYAFQMGASPDKMYKDENGNAVLGMFLPRHKDFLKYIRNLVATGGMDPETATTKYDQVVEKTKAGKVGLVWSYSYYNWIYDMKNLDPNADWRPMPPPKGIYDKGYRMGEGLLREEYAISSKCKNVESVFKLMNYMADDKSTADEYDFSGTYWTSRYGERDVNWKVDDKGAFYATKWAGDPQIKERNQIDSWSGLAGRIQNKFDAAWQLALSEDEQKANKEAGSYPTSYDIPANHPFKFIDSTAWIPSESYAAFSQEWFENKWPVLYYKAILGKEDIDKAWAEFVADAQKSGLDQIIAETTRSLKDDGILK